RSGPVQQIAIQEIDLQMFDAPIARLERPGVRRIRRQDLRDEEDAVAQPRIASPTIASTFPEPYISAVSIWVSPSSMPRRSAAIAEARASRSIIHVPWPRTGTAAPVAPNGRDSIRIV